MSYVRVCQWHGNRVCKACSARGPIAVEGGADEPCVGKKGVGLLESLHAGLLQPCYATGVCMRSVCHRGLWLRLQVCSSEYRFSRTSRSTSGSEWFARSPSQCSSFLSCLRCCSTFSTRRITRRPTGVRAATVRARAGNIQTVSESVSTGIW